MPTPTATAIVLALDTHRVLPVIFRQAGAGVGGGEAAASAEAHQVEVAEFSAGLVREERGMENLVLRVLARPEEPPKC